MALLFQLTTLAHGFQAFWDRYPRRDAKKDAMKAWGQVVKDDPTLEAQIQAALDWQIPLWDERERQFIPLPATYLRGERWTDEKPTPRKATPNRITGRAPTQEQAQQQDANQRITVLMNHGMSRADAVRKVSLEQGWIKP